MLPSVSGDLLLHLVPSTWNVGALLMRMRYSRIKPLSRNAPSQSTISSSAVLLLLATARLAFRVCKTLPKRKLQNSGLSWTPFKQPSRHQLQRRLDCTRTPSTALRTRQLRVVDAFQTTLAPSTSTRLHTYAVDRIANTTTSCRGRLSNNPRAINVDSTAHVRRRPHCEHDNFVSWTPFKQPSRHQRRLDCTRTPSTALRTRQLRVGKPAFLWETQRKNSLETRTKTGQVADLVWSFLHVNSRVVFPTRAVHIQRCEGFI